MQWIILIMQLLPIVLETIAKVQVLFPQQGIGSTKKALVLDTLSAALATKPTSDEQVVAFFSDQIDKAVQKLNAASVFETSK